MEEKRNFKRFDRNVPAKLQILNLPPEDNKKTHYFMTKDICAGGVFLTTKQPFTEGSEVMVEVVLPMKDNLNFNTDNHCLIKVKGIVLRADSTGIAISFLKNFQIEFKELPPYLLNTITSNN
jgi:Tfp pilus assembly protein PilZ